MLLFLELIMSDSFIVNAECCLYLRLLMYVLAILTGPKRKAAFLVDWFTLYKNVLINK